MATAQETTLPGKWHTELGTLWPGQCMCLEIEETLVDERSDFQHIQVYKSKTYGNVLCLDGVIQATERDEFSYQEMMAHLPLSVHPAPKNVLIIGGGDGGVLREVVKWPTVETATLVEIDGKVIEVAKKHLPGMAAGFSSPKARVLVQDGLKHMEENTAHYDVIITDSSDPVGPANVLFERRFYELMRSALNENGIVCCQGECVWLHLDLIKDMMGFCRELYPQVAYAYTSIPTYPSGQIGFLLCGKSASTQFRTPLVSPETQPFLADCKYYNNDMHQAAFLLPNFARKVLNPK